MQRGYCVAKQSVNALTEVAPMLSRRVMKMLVGALCALQPLALPVAWAGHHHGGGHHHHSGGGSHHHSVHADFHYHRRYAGGAWYGHHGQWYGHHYHNRWNWNSFGALAGAAVIGGLISSAFHSNNRTIAVPNSAYQLDYDSIRANGSTVMFNVDGAPMSADCTSGYLNGHAAENRGQAQLVNAVCTVAFGK